MCGHDRNCVKIMPYLATWLTVSKDDKRAIFTAAHAERAADFLRGPQPQAPAPESEMPENAAAYMALVLAKCRTIPQSASMLHLAPRLVGE
jgi:antirestriction protein ArdC